MLKLMGHLIKIDSQELNVPKPHDRTWDRFEPEDGNFNWKLNG